MSEDEIVIICVEGSYCNKPIAMKFDKAVEIEKTDDKHESTISLEENNNRIFISTSIDNLLGEITNAKFR